MANTRVQVTPVKPLQLGFVNIVAGSISVLWEMQGLNAASGHPSDKQDSFFVSVTTLVKRTTRSPFAGTVWMRILSPSPPLDHHCVVLILRSSPPLDPLNGVSGWVIIIGSADHHHVVCVGWGSPSSAARITTLMCVATSDVTVPLFRLPPTLCHLVVNVQLRRAAPPHHRRPR